MKMNIEIELDFIDEECEIDEVVKKEIINQVSTKLFALNKDMNLDDARKTAYATLQKNVEITTEKMFSDFMNQPLTISQGWNKSETYDNVYNYLQDKFEKGTQIYFKENNSASCGFETYFSKCIKNVVESNCKLLQDSLLKTAKQVADNAIAENESIKSLQKLILKAKE